MDLARNKAIPKACQTRSKTQISTFVEYGVPPGVNEYRAPPSAISLMYLPGTCDVTMLIFDSKGSFLSGKGTELSVLDGVVGGCLFEAAAEVEKAPETSFCRALSLNRVLATVHLMMLISYN